MGTRERQRTDLVPSPSVTVEALNLVGCCRREGRLQTPERSPAEISSEAPRTLDRDVLAVRRERGNDREGTTMTEIQKSNEQDSPATRLAYAGIVGDQARLTEQVGSWPLFRPQVSMFGRPSV